MSSLVFEEFLLRIAYAVWLLREVAHHYSSEIHISVMYDVACTLVQHLKVYIYISFHVSVKIIDVFRLMVLKKGFCL